MAELPELAGLTAMQPSELQASILLVDDSRANLLSLEALLEELGQRIVTAQSGEEALRLVQAEEFAVILLDVRMPGVDGLGLLKSLRGMGVETPIFVMTGYDSTQVALEALENGATGYLPKPFDLLHLDKLIAHALGSQPAYA